MSRNLKEYQVSWRINISATSARDAARKALIIQRDRESIASCFEIIDPIGEAHFIDLEDEDA